MVSPEVLSGAVEAAGEAAGSVVSSVPDLVAQAAKLPRIMTRTRAIHKIFFMFFPPELFDYTKNDLAREREVILSNKMNNNE